MGVLVALGVILLATNDRVALAAQLVDPSILARLLALQLAVLAWRLVALGSSLAVARPPRYRPADALPIVLLAALVILPQAYLGAVTNVARDAALSVFGVTDAGPVWRPSSAPAPGSSPANGLPSPFVSPVPGVPRLTVLLIGEDSGVGRNTALTDTMIVASLDPVANTVSMLSIPRDLVDAPIPGGGIWHPKINGLSAWVRWHANDFPGSNGDGQAVLAGVIGELIGVPIDYWAQVNLGGLIRVVDTVGGVDVTVTHGFCDPGYDEYGQNGFGIRAGRWHLNGSQALAYARVRKALGESDFTRAARQQEVLVGLRDALVRGGFLGDPFGFLQAMGQAIRTNIPPSLLPEVATYAERIGRSGVYRAVITHPLVMPTSVPDPRGSIQIPDIPAIRALAAGLFPPTGTLPVIASGAKDPAAPGGTSGSGTGPGASPSPSAGSGSAGGSATAPPAGRAPNAPRLICVAPPPSPSPKPTPSATPVPSASPSGSGEPSPSGGSPSPGASDPGASSAPTASPTPSATLVPSPTLPPTASP